MYDLTGKIAIVTGAGGKRGIGRAIAVRLAKDGAHVVVVDKTEVLPVDEKMSKGWKGTKSVRDEILSLGTKSIELTCDVSESRQVDQMVQNVVSEFGGVDILVNNAGIYTYKPILDMDDAVWKSHMDVNLTGAFYCLRACARVMKQKNKGGRIINISSLNGKTALGISQSAYCASKFGLNGLTQSAALELAPHKILVNAVCPMLTETDIHSDDYQIIGENQHISAQEVSQKKREAVIAKVPLGRLGIPEDTAKMVAFLCSDESSFITGQSINVNGGIFTAH